MRNRTNRAEKPSDQLRRAIEADGRTLCELAEAADIARSILSRFMGGKQGLSTDTIDRLAPVLRLRIVAGR